MAYFHKNLTPTRWRKFSQKQQLLMVANELSRASHWLLKNDLKLAENSWERGIELLDLTLDDQRWAKQRRILTELREIFGLLWATKKPTLNQVLLNHFIQIAEIYE